MMQSRSCPKCEQSMSAGFIIDKTYGSVAVASWVEGVPAKSIWVGVKLRGKSPIEISTWRCNRCGFLESYALSN